MKLYIHLFRIHLEPFKIGHPPWELEKVNYDFTYSFWNLSKNQYVHATAQCHCHSQCANCCDLVSHIFGKNLVKVTFLQKKFLPKKCYTLWVWKKETFLYIMHLMIQSVEIIWIKTVHVSTITFLGKYWHYCVKSKKKAKNSLISRNFSTPLCVIISWNHLYCKLYSRKFF